MYHLPHRSAAERVVVIIGISLKKHAHIRACSYIMRTCRKNEQLPPKTFQRRISQFHKEPPTHSSTDWAQTYRGSPTPPFPVVLLLICCFIIFSNFFSLIFLFSGPGCLALLRLQQQSYGAREHCGSVTSGHFHKLFTGAGKLNLCVRARVLLGL